MLAVSFFKPFVLGVLHRTTGPAWSLGSANQTAHALGQLSLTEHPGTKDPAQNLGDWSYLTGELQMLT